MFEFVPHYIRNFGMDPAKFLKELEDEGFHLSFIDEERKQVLRTGSCI